MGVANCSVILSRILVQHVGEFKSSAKEVVWHIPSRYTKEMSRKSEVVRH